MKKSIAQFAFATLLMSTIFISCKKEDETTPATTPATNTPSGTAGSFTWQENGGAVITADSSFWTTGAWGTGVRAYKGGFANYFEINWATQNNTSVGAKTLNVGSFPDFTFLKGADTYNNSTIQTLNVTAFASNKLSGNFSVAVTGGGSITSISGTFTAIPYK